MSIVFLPIIPADVKNISLPRRFNPPAATFVVPFFLSCLSVSSMLQVSLSSELVVSEDPVPASGPKMVPFSLK